MRTSITINASDVEPGVLILRIEGPDMGMSAMLRNDDGSAFKFAETMKAAYLVLFGDQIPKELQSLMKPFLNLVDQPKE